MLNASVAIEFSDNPCCATIQQFAANLGMQTDLLQQGLSSTNFTGLYPVTTAADVASLFEKIYYQSSLSKSLNDQLLQHLKNQQVVNRFPQGLPAGT